LKKLEEEYWHRNKLVEEEFERFVINIDFASSDEDSDTDNNAAEDENCDTNIKMGDSSTDPVDKGQKICPAYVGFSL
jgi:hypothetical protein